MSIASCFVHAAGKRFTAIAMCPPHLPKKWAREVFLTLPNVRVFIVYDMRNNGDVHKPHGMTEVAYVNGKIVHKGLKVTLSELRKMGRKGFKKICPESSFFIMSKEKGKLGYFWKHAFEVAESGPNNGSVISIDSGLPVETPSGGNLTRASFDTNKYDETLNRPNKGTTVFSPLWQADKNKLQRMAPLDYMGRYMKDFFDYAIADELHQLAGDTAQGNGLAVLGRIGKKLVGLTGTMMGGYADDLYNILYRMDAPQMAQDGYAWGGEGRSVFQGNYGVCEEIVKRYASDNACSKASKASVTIKRKPGCSPLLFGKYLMENTAFVSLEDIAANLPAYNESVIPVEMDCELSKAYTDILEAIKKALEEYPRNPSLTSLMLNTLLCYPDHPFGFDAIYGKIKDKQTGAIEVVHVCDPAELDKSKLYPKEQALLDDVKAELAQGRRVQVFGTFTGRHDVTARLKWVFEQAGLRTAVLKSSVPTDAREAWYEARLAEGVQVVVCHPKLVETGLDLLEFPTIYFYETGYSLFTLRQASRRSWRIGQKHDVRVKFLMYAGTVQENQIRLMGKKLLVAMMMEGKFAEKASTASKRMTTWSRRWFASCSKRAKWANQPMRFGRTLPTSARRCLRRLRSMWQRSRKKQSPTATSHSASPALLRSTRSRRKSQKSKRLHRCQRRASHSWFHRPYPSSHLNRHLRKRTFLRSMRCVPKLPPAASQLWRMRSRCCCSAN